MAVIAVIVGLTGWFYWWTIRPVARVPVADATGNGYYNLLARGFLKGQLALDLKADPALATLKNPNDPVERAGRGIHDGSYYKGRYFLYFGAAPAVLLFVPFRLLSGLFLDEAVASVFFGVAGLVLMAGLLVAMRRRYFPAASLAILGGAVLAAGGANMVPALLRRASFWEVPIMAAHACAVFALWAVYRALHGRSRAGWLALASLAMGAAVAGRPVYLLACAALLLPPAWWWAAGGWRSRVRWVAAAVLPAATVGAGIAWYNWARFENPFQFGQDYQMSGDATNLAFFNASYLWYSVQLYWLAPAGWSPFFPFVTVISPPTPPAGHLGIENPYGIFPNMPYVVLGLGLLCLAYRSRRALVPNAGATLWVWLAAAGSTAGLTMVTVMIFGGITNRYMVDFLPVMVLMAGCGWLALASRGWWRGWAGRIGAGVTGLLLGYSLLFNVLVSFQHNELLRALHGSLYARLAQVANRLPDLYDRAVGHVYGPVELTVVFPRRAAGEIEPLVVTGRRFLSDYVYAHYLGDDSVRFGFEHTNYGGPTGQPIRFVPGEPQRLLIELGSLYPPAEHPYHDRIGAKESRLRRESVSVVMNGKVALLHRAKTYDAVARSPDIGTSADRVAFKRPFTGKILENRVLADPIMRAGDRAYGPVAIALKLPPFTGKRNEPLVSSGVTGKGNLVYIRYVDAKTVIFGYDHWGVGGFESEPMAVEPEVEQLVTIDYGALYPAGTVGEASVVIRLNNRVALDRPWAFHACAADTVKVGANPIGASTANAEFTGKIVEDWRVRY